MNLREALNECPLVAILRGITPEEAVDIGHVLVEAGFRVIEVPLNSPRPFESIARLVETFGDRALIGAGTMLRAQECRELAEAGGRVMVSPNFDARVIAAAKGEGLFALPGVATVSEAFGALEAGADALKLFPAETVGQSGLKAWRAVLPKEVALLPVGGVQPGGMRAWWDAGANGFGIGSALYAPGKSVADVERVAAQMAQEAQALPRR